MLQIVEAGRGSNDHRFGRLTRKAAAKNGNLGQKGLFARFEQLPGVVKDGLERALAARQVTPRAVQEVQVAGHGRQDLIDQQPVQRCCCQQLRYQALRFPKET